MEQEVYQTARLVEEIEKRLERSLNEQVRHAFLEVPRHRFLEHYYRQQGNRLAWDPITTPTPEEIYRDEALVTKIDERGHPISSSSQPSVMACQLEALHLRPEQSVLEIGTGTGYNAALMGVLVGPNGRVTSIDIDPELVATAAQHMSEAGVTNVLISEGDGFEGYPQRAPYDRLLATCAVRTLPRSWIAQLASRGLLLVNLRLNLSHPFLLLEKVAPMKGDGCLLDLNASYMEMHGADGLPPSLQVDWSHYDSQPRDDIRLPANLAELLKRPAYCVLLECLLPGLRKKYRVFPGETEIHTYLLDVEVPGSAIQVQEDHVTIIDQQDHLKTQLLRSFQLYEHFDLTLDDYSVSVDETGSTLRLRGMRFPFAI